MPGHRGQVYSWKTESKCEWMNVAYTTFCFSKLDILAFSIFTSPSFCTNAWVNLWIWEASAWQPLTWRRVATWFFKTKRKYRNVLNYWSIYCPHKMQLCRQWQQQTNKQNAARWINNCNFSIVSEQRVRMGVQIRFTRNISPVLRANMYSEVLINLGHYLQPLQMLFCHIVYLDHPFVSGL